MYQLLQDLPKKYNVTALVRLEKVRGSQLLPLRKKLLGEVEIVSIKDKVAKKSLRCPIGELLVSVTPGPMNTNDSIIEPEQIMVLF